MANPYDDVELDAAGMRALAHPVRVRILFRLRSAPATATMLSTEVGASPSVTSWHLRHLAQHGLITDAPELGRGRERYWRTVGNGFRFAVDDEASRSAALALQSVLDDVSGDVVADWRTNVGPTLEPEWTRQSGTQDTTIAVTVGELAELNRAVEELLARYVNRTEPPQDARLVRLIRHTLPSAD
jgi:DNA-binding transcriptional ArsR family regulator